jgi:hypothetical protein
MLAHEHINRGVFPFFMIWSLYPAFPGQATPSAFGLFGVAKTLSNRFTAHQLFNYCFNFFVGLSILSFIFQA